MLCKVSELTGDALDWAVCVTGGFKMHYVAPNEKRGTIRWEVHPSTRRYSSNWIHGGPIIESYGINTSREADNIWAAYFLEQLFKEDGSECWQTAQTPLIAAMRCFVASKYGETIEIPDELINA